MAAANLYRGDLFADVPEAEWLAFDRDHYRRQFVAAATRAGQLLVGLGDLDRAEGVDAPRSAPTRGPRMPTPCSSPRR